VSVHTYIHNKEGTQKHQTQTTTTTTLQHALRDYAYTQKTKQTNHTNTQNHKIQHVLREYTYIPYNYTYMHACPCKTVCVSVHTYIHNKEGTQQK
jgi:hypothetical protein